MTNGIGSIDWIAERMGTNGYMIQQNYDSARYVIWLSYQQAARLVSTPEMTVIGKIDRRRIDEKIKHAIVVDEP
ncbi:hypothetical protein [Pseudomonas sp. NFIX28]|uniref:hypothetical protein n=1 Tax=Pseudomonas sp. NFIX28 TaxID=1566235 RepID=UPI0011143E9D|nr:hypothetical protein [Pseudomonas sp. NFIX28]